LEEGVEVDALVEVEVDEGVAAELGPEEPAA
jgi:hypothetical protein